MKSKSVLSHLATALAAAMLTVCPAASPAAGDAPDAQSSSAPQCPLPPRAPAGRDAADIIREANGAGVAPAAEESDLSPSEENDLAGALLEDLVRGTLLPPRPPRTEVRRLPVTR